MDEAGISVSHAAHTLAGSPADIQHLVHRILVALIELNQNGAEFPLLVEPDDDRHISL